MVKPGIRVYIAAPWVYRSAAQAFARELEARGITVQSTWQDKHEGSDDPAVLASEALKDCTDMGQSTVMVVLNLCTSEGKAVEQGVFLALGRPIVVVGKPSNIFHRLGDDSFVFVDTPEDAIAALASL